MKKCLVVCAFLVIMATRVYGADIVKIDAQDLIRQYSLNEIAADKKFMGQTLVVTGKITDITKDLDGDVYVAFGSKNPFDDVDFNNPASIDNMKVDDTIFDSVDCYFDNPDDVASLVKGQTVTIEGKCKGKELMEIELRNCKIVK